jgi:hypothetical protein
VFPKNIKLYTAARPFKLINCANPKHQRLRRRIRVILVPHLSYGLTNQLYELLTSIAWAAATGAEVRPPRRALRWAPHARQNHCRSARFSNTAALIPTHTPIWAPTPTHSGP